MRNDPARLEMAQSIQDTMGQAGMKVEIKTGTGAEILTAYRARTHELILDRWGPDYPDPKTNASTFARNADNSDEAKLTGVLAWRNAWAATETTDDGRRGGAGEGHRQARRRCTRTCSASGRRSSPFAALFQEIEQVGLRKNVDGFSTGARSVRPLLWDGDEELSAPLTRNSALPSPPRRGAGTLR